MARNENPRLSPPRERKSRRRGTTSPASLEAQLGLNLKSAEFSEVARSLSRMPAASRAGVARSADRLLGVRKYGGDEPTRVALVKLVVAAFPDSAPLIRRRVIEASGSYASEICFTIFCFLDRIQDLPVGAEHSEFVPALVECYLQNVRSNAGHAAWMAGDLLGDHWRLSVSVPILLRLAESARFVAGRDSAIHGLGHAMRTDGKSATVIESALRRIATSDRSLAVRGSARIALKDRPSRPASIRND
jgi:hypothetical protein